MPDTNSSRTCAHCGVDISHKQLSAKYCCREHKNEAWYEANRERERERARNYMRNRKAIDPEFAARQFLSATTFKDRNPASYKRINKKHYLKRNPPKYDAHVKARNAWMKIRHDQHVVAFRDHKRIASNGWHARYWRRVGRPWANPRLSAAVAYRIRYKCDLGFRLREATRSGWRRATLSAQNDGTVNFWQLLRERKTCPYCGTKITQDNACGDHMDPVRLGGSNGNHNLTICCKPCNAKKAGKSFQDWVAMLPDTRRRAALRWYVIKHKHQPDALQAPIVFEFNAS